MRRGSSDTYDMVNGVVCVVCQADDYLGQEGMSSDQLYAALRHYMEQLALVLTRRLMMPRRKQHHQTRTDFLGVFSTNV